MLKRKKSQGMPVNVIIIAAIGLAVLVILFFILTGRFNVFSKGIKETGFTCQESCKLSNYASGVKSTGDCAADHSRLGGTISGIDTQKNEVCCCIKTLFA